MNNVYQIVTDRILAELAKGVIPWRKPWVTANMDRGAYSLTTGKPYSLFNQMLLSRPDAYVTFKQCAALGGKVKKGAKSEIVVFFKMTDSKTETIINPKTGKKEPKKIPVLRYYNVFWVGDCENLNVEPREFHESGLTPDEHAEQIVTHYEQRDGIKINRDGMTDDAYYNWALDYINVPSIGQFSNVSEYYSTLFHEMTHSTGHADRLNRSIKNRFGNNSYAKEELVAEMGAAMLLNECNLDIDSTIKNSAAYIEHWRDHIAHDNKLVVQAASKAAAAVDYIIDDTDYNIKHTGRETA